MLQIGRKLNQCLFSLKNLWPDFLGCYSLLLKEIHRQVYQQTVQFTLYDVLERGNKCAKFTEILSLEQKKMPHSAICLLKHTS